MVLSAELSSHKESLSLLSVFIPVWKLFFVFLIVQHFLHVLSPAKMQSLQNTSSMKCRAGLQVWDAGSTPRRLTLTDSPVTSAARCNNSRVPLRLQHLSFQARRDNFHVKLPCTDGCLSLKLSRSPKVWHWPRSQKRDHTWWFVFYQIFQRLGV